MVNVVNIILIKHYRVSTVIVSMLSTASQSRECGCRLLFHFLFN